jgi:hypothetical protein
LLPSAPRYEKEKPQVVKPSLRVREEYPPAPLGAGVKEAAAVPEAEPVLVMVALTVTVPLTLPCKFEGVRVTL